MQIKITKLVPNLEINKSYTVFADLNNSRKSQRIYDNNDNEIFLIDINECFVIASEPQSYTFNQLSITAQNNAYCEWLSILSFDDGMEDTSKEYFANMMQNDSCFDVNGECLVIEDDNY